MILWYMLRFLAFIFIMAEKQDHAYAKKLKVHAKGKHTSGEKKTLLQGADPHVHELHGYSVQHVPFPVHIPVKHPDVHELHVHIHEGKSIQTGNYD